VDEDKKDVMTFGYVGIVITLIVYGLMEKVILFVSGFRHFFDNFHLFTVEQLLNIDQN